MYARNVRGAAAITLLFVFLPVASVLACPDLSGTFQCPALDGMPASTLVVTNKAMGEGIMQYVFTYKIGGKDMNLRADASDKGIKKPDGQVTSCNATTYIHKGPNERGEGTRSFINASGNFEAVQGGKTQRVCVRKAN